MNVDEIERLEVAWQPAHDAFGSSPLGRMAVRWGLHDYESVADRATRDPDWFWTACAEDVGLRWTEPFRKAIDLTDGPEFPHYFVGGRLNWADYSVDRWVSEGHGDRQALWSETEDGAQQQLSYSLLKDMIDRCAGALLELGVTSGDRVALLLPMTPEAVATVLATAKVGAIAVPLFSGFGSGAVRDRLDASGAKILVTCDGFRRRGRTILLKQLADEAVAGCGSVRHVMVVRRLRSEETTSGSRDRDWDEMLSRADPCTVALPMDSEDPCLLMYSSGSTGSPKGCVHTHAGFPFRAAQEARHNLGMDDTGRILWVTDMGWIVGAFVIAAALTNGGTLVLYEGAFDHPGPDRLWAIAESSRCTVLGLSPTAVRSLMRHGDHLPRSHDLNALRVLGSTGEPWSPSSWHWLFEHVGRKRLPIVNFSGGTETGSALVTGTILRPMKPASFSGPSLGVPTDVVDEAGRSLRCGVGELVVRGPWPGMTKGLWEGKQRYIDAYWRKFPGLWHQGDFAYIDSQGFWFLLGRSDETLKLGGKRVGPAEIESVVVEDEAVVEAAAVGVPDEVKGELLVVFIVVQPEAAPDAVATRVASEVERRQGHALRPHAVHPVPALPKTRSGKILRRVARAAYLGTDPGDLGSLDDQAVLEPIAVLGHESRVHV